jgi:hypothetical protein
LRISELEWDDENIEHIAWHDVNPEEVEDVCFGTHLSRRESNRRYVLSGQTAAGKHLNVVIEQVGKGLFRPITAFAMSERYKRRYKKRVRKG